MSICTVQAPEPRLPGEACRGHHYGRRPKLMNFTAAASYLMPGPKAAGTTAAITL